MTFIVAPTLKTTSPEPFRPWNLGKLIGQNGTMAPSRPKRRPKSAARPNMLVPVYPAGRCARSFDHHFRKERGAGRPCARGKRQAEEGDAPSRFIPKSFFRNRAVEVRNGNGPGADAVLAAHESYDRFTPRAASRMSWFNVRFQDAAPAV